MVFLESTSLYYCPVNLPLHFLQNDDQYLNLVERVIFGDRQSDPVLNQEISQASDRMIEGGIIKHSMPDLLLKWILWWTLKLLGHDSTAGKEGWVISCFHGQVVFPQLFATEPLPRTGFLELCCVAGNLSLKGKSQLLQIVQSRFDYRYDGSDLPKKLTGADNTATRSLNLYPLLHVEWVVTTNIDGTFAELEWDTGNYRRRPYNLLVGMFSTSSVEKCKHSPDRSLEVLATDCSWISPAGAELLPGSASQTRVSIVPTSGDNGVARICTVKCGTTVE